MATLLACASVQARIALASAQPTAADPARVGAGVGALRGLIYTGLPLAERELTLRATAGYGFLERVPPAPGAQHRLQGALALGITPLSWLGFALRFDGRLELHADDGMGSHIAGYGDPHLQARAGHALRSDLWLGVELGAWFPGRQAPSFPAEATTLDGRLQLAYHTRGSLWTWLGSAGARWDNSAQAAPDLTRLRVGDRVALGLSSSSSVLVALGAAWQLQPRVQVFAELSGDVLVGARAPSFAASPLRAAVGARYALSSTLTAELTPMVSLSSRPAVDATAALVPIEPRMVILLGLSYTLPLTAAASSRADRPKPAAAVSTPKLPPVTDLTGQITDERGEALPDVRVTLTTVSGVEHTSLTDYNGSYHFSAIALGDAQLETQAVGFKTQNWTVTLVADTAASQQPARALVPAANTGLLRGLIRSFDSSPLRAKLTVKNARGKVVQTGASNDDGTVELELAPGKYTITVEAAGHRNHTQAIQVQGNGVSVLNADLRKKK